MFTCYPAALNRITMYKRNSILINFKLLLKKIGKKLLWWLKFANFFFLLLPKFYHGFSLNKNYSPISFYSIFLGGSVVSLLRHWKIIIWGKVILRYFFIAIRYRRSSNWLYSLSSQKSWYWSRLQGWFSSSQFSLKNKRKTSISSCIFYL